MQRRAIGIVGVGRGARRAGEDAAHAAELVGGVVEGLGRGAGQVFALGVGFDVASWSGGSWAATS